MIPVVELIRVSTETQAAEGRAGIPAQRAANQKTCRQYGLRIVETVELVKSGTDVAQTPEMAHVLELVAQGRARGIVLAEYSRLFRPDRWADMVILQELDDHGAQLYLPTGPVDLRSQTGMVQASVYTLMARLERIYIRQRMQGGKEEKRKLGEHVSGGIGIPFGLKYDKESGWGYTPDIEKVRELFRRFLDGEHNYQKLGDDLGIPRTSVRYILQNPVYKGERVYDQKRDLSAAGKYQGGDRRKIARAPDEVIRVQLGLEPVVSEEAFQRVQEIIEQRRQRVIRSRRNPTVFTYAGFLHCGAPGCGLLIYSNQKVSKGGRRTPGRAFYYCKSKNPQRRLSAGSCGNKYMVKGRLERELDTAIRDRLLDRDLLSSAVAEYNRSLETDWHRGRVDEGRIRGKLSELDQRRSRILDTYYDGLIDRSEREAKLEPVDRDLEAVRRLIDQPAESPLTITPESIFEFVSVFAEWAFLEAAQKRRILDAVRPIFFVYRYLVQGVLFASGNIDSHSKTGS